MLLNKIIEFESNFPGVQSKVVEKTYGRIFFNKENPLSHDSNHAIINEDADYEFAVNDIVNFYKSIDISPRVYTFTNKNRIGQYLESKGFNKLTEENCFYIQKNIKIIDVPKTLEIKRLRNIDNAIDELLHTDKEQGEWGYKDLIKQIDKEGFHLFGGYEHKTLACIVSIQFQDDISRLNIVFTRKDKRGKGYCSQLINFITDYNNKYLGTTSYLYSNNLSAIRVYRKAGYEEIDNIIRGCYWL